MASKKRAAASKVTFAAWARRLRAAAKRDEHRALAVWLDDHGTDPESAPEIVENNIARVAFVCAIYVMEKRPGIEDFLARQTYVPDKSAAKYLLWFHPHDPGCLAVDELSEIDLAELFSAAPGFMHLYVDRVDDAPLSAEERTSLGQAIRDDFAYDFAPDELTMEVHDNGSGLALNVCESDEDPPWRG